MNIKDKVVIITGASSGIGLEIAKLLAQHGARLVLAARSEKILNELAATLPDSIVIPTDMAAHSSIKNMIDKTYKHYGRIDILINNAGQSLIGLVEQIKLDQYRYLLELNLIGPLLAMQMVIPIMRKQKGGMIVNISSGTTRMYLPNIAGYASTKYALNAISLTARKELAKDKIIVSVVYPYITKTNFHKNALRSSDKVYQPESNVARERPGNRPVPDSPEHVAEHILAVIQNENAEEFVQEFLVNRE